jgi:acylphosphatase
VAKRETRIARRFVVRGRVQGVGYRSFAQHAASLTGVSGWVRNRDDGSVEAVACGTKEQLDAFAGYVHTGPRWGEVRSVEVSECAPPANSGFSIRH